MPGVDSTAVERSVHPVDAELGVSVRVNRLRGGSGPSPCVLSMHGGGYIMAGPPWDDPLFEAWCPSLGVVVFSVDYRLAPEDAVSRAPGRLLPRHWSGTIATRRTNSASIPIDWGLFGVSAVAALAGLAGPAGA